MGKKTSIWIMSVLFGLGIIAAYHSDSKRMKAMQVNYPMSGAATDRPGVVTLHGV